MNDLLLFEIASWVFRLFLIVLPICTIAIWLLLPAHNGTFTRAFRHLFAAFSLILIHASFTRLGGYHATGLGETGRLVGSMTTWGLCIATAPRAMIAAYGARSEYRSEVVRLTTAATVAAKETEVLAAAAKDAAADEALTHGGA